jgi:tetratricopeptide (TPR) repeat protein
VKVAEMLNDQSLNFFLGIVIVVLAWSKIKNLDESAWQHYIFDALGSSSHAVEAKPQAAQELEMQIADLKRDTSQLTRLSSLQVSLGHVYREAGLHEIALGHYQHALTDANQVKDLNAAGNALAAIADLHLSLGQIHEVRRKVEKSVHLIDPSTEGGLQALRALVKTCLLSGHEEQALDLLSKMLVMLRGKTTSQNTQAILLSEIGAAHQSRGNLHKAKTYLKQALSSQEKAGISHEIALTYGRLGRTLHRLGNVDAALALHRKALQLQEQSDGQFLNMAEIHCDLARAQRDSSEGRSMAIATVEKAEELLQGKESSTEYGTLALLKADLLHSNGELDKAEVYARKAIQTLQNALGEKDTPQVASALNSLGMILTAQHRFSDALEHHRQALVIGLKTYGLFHTGAALSYTGMGEAYKHLGNGGAAKRCFEKRAEIETRLK